jgi:hypothetical protein
MKNYSESDIVGALKYYKTTIREKRWWLDIYRGVKLNRYKGSSWDFQFIFAIWVNRGKSIVPNVNLSTNIGFGLDATHTTKADSVTANRPTLPILPIIYPSQESICRFADLFYHDFYYDKFVEKISYIKKIKRLIKKQLKVLRTRNA